MADVEMRDPVVEKDKEKEKDKPTELSPQEAQALLLAGILYIFFSHNHCPSYSIIYITRIICNKYHTNKTLTGFFKNMSRYTKEYHTSNQICVNKRTQICL